MPEQLHRAQLSILDTLRHTPDASFSMLMKPTGMQSDTFKFHIRKLRSLGYVEKGPTGLYTLTAAGKEFANDLDDARRTIQKQPKVSLIIVVKRITSDGAVEYLMQQRQRNPYYGLWGNISGPARWGEDFNETATAELQKQTGLTAACQVRLFMRQMDKAAEDGSLLEDKLFVVLEAEDVTDELSNDWRGGHNRWMTIREFETQKQRFPNTTELISTIDQGKSYLTVNTNYPIEDY